MKNNDLHANLLCLTSRMRQRYAASCLRSYCSAKKISHSSLDDLLSHLDSIAVAEDIPEWEAKGARLALNGRGDPPPETLSEKLKDNERQELIQLVEYVVEVGLVDLYGSTTDAPLTFLEKIVCVLERNHIPLPSIYE
ncbi:hypothetical protein [Achromobacter sp. NCFB-sbj8-Ac1-l]|uniref:hypothetical protein n=1 Tax=unclassified Achromobacter TaxID=2626865 RepID=UPI004046C3E6